MAINKKSNVQTGPKIQFGGLKNGFARSLYQVVMDGIVNKEPSPAATKQTIIAKTNFKIFAINIIFFN
jgi:hypothetical protein